MTYSIIARCPRTGRFGVGSTTFSMACGRRNESVRPNVGVSKSQAFYLRRVDPFVLNMLAQGHTPGHIAELLEQEGRKDEALELLKRAMKLQTDTHAPIR